MSKVHILHITTHDENCGIAKYQKQFIDNMSNSIEVENQIFEYSPNKTKIMSKREYGRVLNKLKVQLKNFEILHIQHEFSFYKHNELKEMIKIANNMGKKVIVTIHTAPASQFKFAHLSGIGPRSVLHYIRIRHFNKILSRRHVEPLKKADLIIVHNEATKQNLEKMGFKSSKIKKIVHPVPIIQNNLKISNKIKDALRLKSGDIVFCTVGFISDSKGMMQAVKALSFLSTNYKLAIIGGIHPDSENKFYDDLADKVVKLGLVDRVYITGYIDDDDDLSSLIRECNVAVYPFDKDYYSYVSSGSMNMAISNLLPIIAYPMPSLIEMNAEINVVNFCKSGNYYELARKLQEIDIKSSNIRSRQYADKFAWDIESKKLEKIYKDLIV